MPSSSTGFEIEIIRQSGGTQPSTARLRNHTAAMLRSLGLPRAALSIVLCNDRQIQAYNKKYLRHDRPTDVMAFSQLEEDSALPEGSGGPFLGDILISLQTARRQAREYGTSFEYEVFFYLCHGILHILGFDDRTARERGRMHQIQEQILDEAGIKKTDRKK